MASENLLEDQNGRNVAGGITNDINEFIKMFRVNPANGRLIVDAHLTSTNTEIGNTIPGGTAGSVLFLGLGSTLAQDNSHFFYDDTNHRLGLGTIIPTKTLHIVGGFRYVDGNQATANVLISDASGNASWNNLATNSTFITNLVANNTFTTNLANNSNFYTTLANNNSFVTDVANNSTFITNISTNISGSVAVVTDATLTGDGTSGNPLHVVSGGSGTVTSVSVVSSNGFAGTVASPTTTPAITIETDQTGVLTGNGSALVAIPNPSVDTLFGWDDTDDSNSYINIGTNLSYDHSTHTLNATGGGGGEWTYLEKVTFTNSSTEQDFSALSVHDQWMLIFNLTCTNTGSPLEIDTRMNSISSADYSYIKADGGGSLSGQTKFVMVTQGAPGTGDDNFLASYVLQGKHFSGIKTIASMNAASGQLNDDILGSRGFLLGDANDLSEISIIPTVAINGTVELWFKDNQ